MSDKNGLTERSDGSPCKKAYYIDDWVSRFESVTSFLSLLRVHHIHSSFGFGTTGPLLFCTVLPIENICFNERMTMCALRDD